MKANELPEKIFLEWYRIGDKKYRDWCITPKTNNEPVEYIRTDAFIEKAEKWLNEHILDYVYAKEQGQGVGVEGELFDDFKNYMKREQVWLIKK